MSDDEKPPRSATDDLANGLGLLLRAARKAVGRIDRDTIERGFEKVEGVVDDLGNRAADATSRLDREKVRDLGRKAVKNLDPRKVEAFAEEAGKEFINVVSKVASRVEGAVRDLEKEEPAARTEEERAPPTASKDEPPVSADEEPEPETVRKEGANGAGSHEPPQPSERVRLPDGD